MALLAIDQVTVAYDKVEAVRGVSLAIEPGQIVTVIGPNGAGKTTLLNAAIGLLRWRGRMSFDGVDLRRLDVEARIERGFCLVPETRELFGDLSVSDNLLLGGYSRRRDSAGLKQSLADVYKRFPRLSERRSQRASTLSGGERQMLALGRALMAKPRLLMLDEPSLGLAPLIIREVFRIISSLRELGVSILLVEQNARAALETADFGYVLETGEIVHSGAAAKPDARPARHRELPGRALIYFRYELSYLKQLRPSGIAGARLGLRRAEVKVAVLGAGPAGLYFAISMKRRNPAHEITVFERNRPDDTFGWGVVLSAETLDNLAANDAVSAAWIREYFAYWDDIAVVHKGVRTVSTGHGFCGIGRKRLLLLLQRRARDLGIELVFESEIADPRPFMASHDLVIGADGLNSHSRATFAEVFKPDIDVRKCKFVWLGTRPEVRRRLHLHLRGDRARLGVGARLPVRRRDRDLHRRMQRGDLGGVGLRRHDPRAVDRGLRADLRQASRRPAADVQRRPPARLGLDQFPARALRALVAQEPRPAGRRLGQRAFLDRLGHQARARERSRAGRLPPF